MPAEKLSTAIPVADMGAAVAAWTELLGVEPTFVDGDRWAQFDLAGGRLSLAGADRVADEPVIMLKVADLVATRDALVASGRRVDDIAEGAHELRCVVPSSDDLPTLVLYSPR